jgi:hypothetical protein
LVVAYSLAYLVVGLAIALWGVIVPTAEVAFEIVAWVIRWAEPASLAGGIVGGT